MAVSFRRRRRAFRAFNSKGIFYSFFRCTFVRSFRRDRPFYRTFCRVGFSARNTFYSFSCLIARANTFNWFVCALYLCRYKVRVRAGRTSRAPMRVIRLREGIRFRIATRFRWHLLRLFPLTKNTASKRFSADPCVHFPFVR